MLSPPPVAIKHEDCAKHVSLARGDVPGIRSTEKYRYGIQTAAIQPAARGDGRLRKARRSSRQRARAERHRIGRQHATPHWLLRPRSE